ncbi:MAG TPA: methyltransferase [Lacibacter sp.]|nr:methyltransferase [Lacibacter sp.]
MPNNYFQFKQFTVHQENAALRVSTDSCLFGAWIANEMKSEKKQIRNILDVGTGTGLLMLMLAQQCEGRIDGIEIDGPSCSDAEHNLESSPWTKRLTLLRGDVRMFQFSGTYDWIISNPPFYEGDLKSEAANRNTAMHDAGLKLNELLVVVHQHLQDKGSFAVLLPYHRCEKFIVDALQYQLYLKKRMDVAQSVNHTFFRTMLLFDRNRSGIEHQSMAIKEANQMYSDEFIQLLREYYLYL